MSPRIAYWTSGFEPQMEAISAEVAMLRRHFPGSVAWGLSSRHLVLLSWSRGFCLNPRFHLVFRAATRLLAPAFQIHHIFGSLGDWFYLEGRRRQPTILTVAGASDAVDLGNLQAVDRFVVEVPSGRTALEKLGLAAKDIRLIFPPVDLNRFVPAPRPAGPFTVLFASSPDEASWIEARGVHLILAAAALRPAMRFRLLWRPWGNSLPRIHALLCKQGLANVQLVVGRHADMVSHYGEAHVTAAPFTDPSRCKPAPHSVIESLACGRPVVVTRAVGLAELINESSAGAVCEPSGPALAESLDQVESSWRAAADQARKLAERCFGRKRFLESYERLYGEVIPRG